VIFSSPVAIAAKQTFTCGYLAPSGHYSRDQGALAAHTDNPPLHIPANGGVFHFGTQATAWPTSVWRSTNYWVDVVFSTSTGSSTWISSSDISASGGTAKVLWNTAAPSDSQAEYGTTTAYGNTTPLDSAKVTTHSAAINGLSPGVTYHYRVRSRDADAVVAIGPDHIIGPDHSGTPGLAVSVSTSPANAIIASGKTQQFMAKVSNNANAAVTWSATTGTISSSGLFTAPSVSTSSSVRVTATSQADPTKSASVSLTVNPPVPILSVNPASLNFTGQTGTSSPAPANVSITNSGAGSLTFTGVSDQPWLALSASSGSAPSTLKVLPSITGLKAGSYTGHITVTGGGATRIVTIALSVTSAAVQHEVALSWKANTNAHVVSYSMYRSSGGPFSLLASAIGGTTFTDPSVQSGMTYYYVVTAVDEAGQESAHSNQANTPIP
jgi:Domain of unknown function (DUF4082)/Viral BACON domain